MTPVDLFVPENANDTAAARFWDIPEMRQALFTTGNFADGRVQQKMLLLEKKAFPNVLLCMHEEVYDLDFKEWLADQGCPEERIKLYCARVRTIRDSAVVRTIDDSNREPSSTRKLACWSADLAQKYPNLREVRSHYCECEASDEQTDDGASVYSQGGYCNHDGIVVDGRLGMRYTTVTAEFEGGSVKLQHPYWAGKECDRCAALPKFAYEMTIVVPKRKQHVHSEGQPCLCHLFERPVDPRAASTTHIDSLDATHLRTVENLYIHGDQPKWMAEDETHAARGIASPRQGLHGDIFARMRLAEMCNLEMLELSFISSGELHHYSGLSMLMDVRLTLLSYANPEARDDFMDACRAMADKKQWRRLESLHIFSSGPVERLSIEERRAFRKLIGETFPHLSEIFVSLMYSAGATIEKEELAVYLVDLFGAPLALVRVSTQDTEGNQESSRGVTDGTGTKAFELWQTDVKPYAEAAERKEIGRYEEEKRGWRLLNGAEA